MLIKRFNMKLYESCKLSLFIFILMLPQAANALDSDRDKPMKIDAGKLIIYEKQGISHYLGNVKITQGSRTISGESISIYSKADDVDKIVIKGEPASFSQLNDQNETIKASGNEMVFYSAQDLLVMTQNAVLQQKDNVFRSEKISYNTAKDVITAGNDDSKDERIKITIHPKEENQTPQ